jgi:hypothetical protein
MLVTFHANDLKTTKKTIDKIKLTDIINAEAIAHDYPHAGIVLNIGNAHKVFRAIDEEI